jgi:hypothetical protein
MSGEQLNLLAKIREEIPVWFLQYETRNIEYTGLLYKLAIAYGLVDERILALNDSLLQSLIHEVKKDDEGGLITPFYLLSLRTIAMLEFCQIDCYTLEDHGFNLRISAILKYIRETQNEEIRNALACQNYSC